ncbi:hypothetical protein [Butyrivibrio virus Ceridwen]|nr:hypothetical protein [Butyrivibrio virus Ceridwen]
MTREELKAHCLNQIEMCKTWAVGKGEEPSGKIYEEHKLILELLEQEPKWIPTSERDPRPDDEYKLFLVTDDKGKVSVQEFYLSLDEEPQPYFSGMTNVVAWMPLPEPYREVEDG